MQKKYADDSSKSVLLNEVPSVPYILKHKLLKTDFLNKFRERKHILEYIEKNYKWVINPNTLTTNLKRMDDILIIAPNPNQKKGYVYKRRMKKNL